MDDTTSSREDIRRILYQVSGFVLLLLIWQAAGKMGVAGKTLPALTDVLAVYGANGRRALLLRATLATASSAGIGLLAGTCLGIVAALVTYLTPALRPGLDRLAVVVNAVPAIALGPVLIITAGRQATPALLAAIPVFFLIYVAATTGLAPPTDASLSSFARAGRAGGSVSSISTQSLPCPRFSVE
ncbi:hypothetical protein GRAN_1588 [Granulicella sibirica]|uniref:Alkanesulfonates transport system permease protein n=1 Tax=Granulicella sibirica TaxID=2479048 RepID=A0A4Q0T818_9BACT|nr:hypothetical protein GRAN_1588 [Granulicella sibirica]